MIVRRNMISDHDVPFALWEWDSLDTPGRDTCMLMIGLDVVPTRS
jgi:hypothetical protein